MNAAAINERSNTMPSSTSDREVVLSRTFDAPRDLVFAAFTDPKHMGQWWGPTGFTTTTHSVDVRPGGEWRFTMHGPDGRDYPNRITYREIVRPERLAYSHGDDTDSIHFETVITFEVEAGNKTRLTMRSVFPTAEALDYVVREHGAIEGGKQHLERLAEHLATMPEFVISRTFDAPRELMFRVWTEKEHLAHWWGPKGYKVFSCTNDPRPGGLMHYGMRGPDGGEMWGRWVYREIDPPARLEFISSFSNPSAELAPVPFEGNWPPELLSVITFDEQGGRTTVTVTWSPYNANEVERAEFDAGRASMTGGWTGTFERLGDYLTRI